MNSILTSADPLLLLVLKGTVLLLAATSATFLLRNKAASLRHFIWLCSAAALLLLPLMQQGLPALPVAVASLTPEISADRPIPESPPLAIPRSLTPTETFDEARQESAPFARTDESLASAPVSVYPVRDRLPEPVIGAAATDQRRIGWIGLLWTGGFVFFLLLRIAADWKVFNILRGCRPVAARGKVSREAEAAASRLQLTRQPRLLASPAINLPFACGLLRPRVVLPAAAEEWSEPRLRSVLLHELAHVRRRDCLSQFIIQIARAAFWFHPLAWWMERQARVEGEKAADDLVLQSGEEPSRYGRLLVELATSASKLPAGAVAMARRSTLEGRLLAIMDRKRNRGILTRALASFAAVATVSISLPIAALQLTAREGPVASETPLADREETVELIFSLEATDPANGEPRSINGASMTLLFGSNAEMGVGSHSSDTGERLPNLTIFVTPNVRGDRIHLAGAFQMAHDGASNDAASSLARYRRTIDMEVISGEKTRVASIGLGGADNESGEVLLFVTATTPPPPFEERRIVPGIPTRDGRTDPVALVESAGQWSRLAQRYLEEENEAAFRQALAGVVYLQERMVSEFDDTPAASATKEGLTLLREVESAYDAGDPKVGERLATFSRRLTDMTDQFTVRPTERGLPPTPVHATPQSPADDQAIDAFEAHIFRQIRLVIQLLEGGDVVAGRAVIGTLDRNINSFVHGPAAEGDHAAYVRLIARFDPIITALESAHETLYQSEEGRTPTDGAITILKSFVEATPAMPARAVQEFETQVRAFETAVDRQLRSAVRLLQADRPDSAKSVLRSAMGMFDHLELEYEWLPANTQASLILRLTPLYAATEAATEALTADDSEGALAILQGILPE